jgi:exopolyphosphatase/guanosine-5'-triphosphate,3'-diphosphate pyrophosphatase
MSKRTPQKKDAGLEAARALADRYDPDPEHAVQVCSTAEALFDATRGLHGLGREHRRLLTAAALMHDVGLATQPAQHHKGSRDLILETKLPGFTEEEVKILACTARYHRKAHPQPGHRVYGDLGDEARQVVAKLAAILRIADGLDRSHLGATTDLRLDQHGHTLCVYVRQKNPSPMDIWGAMRKRQLFEETFRVDVEILPETK